MYLGKRAVVTDASGECERNVALHAFIEDPLGENPLFDGLFHRAAPEDLVDGPEMVAMPVFDRFATFDVDAERGSEQALFDIVMRLMRCRKGEIDVPRRGSCGRDTRRRPYVERRGRA